MPALFAVCTRCNYQFTFDYDFRQERCQKCRAKFDWKGNPRETSSFHSELGSETSRIDQFADSPVLPGEPGYEKYQQEARKRHDQTIVETDRPEERWK